MDENGVEGDAIQAQRDQSYSLNAKGLNTHWLVCRECLTAWPPNDIKADHVHYDGPDEGPWERCEGKMVELEPVV